MKPFHTGKQHKMDTLFPVVLFFVFALCALTVLLLSANIYRSTTKQSVRAYNAQTGLHYISEKIHQNDVAGGVQIGTLGEEEALILTQTREDVTYSTYLYAYENELKELSLTGNATAGPEAGTAILEIQEFEMEEVKPGLYRFSCTDPTGDQLETFVATRSR